MKSRVKKALTQAGFTIDPDELRINNLSDRYYEAIKRIKYRDLLTALIVLKKYPDISAEWVIRGKGPMLINDDLQLAELKELKASNTELRKKLSREAGRANYFESKLAEPTKQKKKRGRGRPRGGSED